MLRIDCATLIPRRAEKAQCKAGDDRPTLESLDHGLMTQPQQPNVALSTATAKAIVPESDGGIFAMLSDGGVLGDSDSFAVDPTSTAGVTVGCFVRDICWFFLQWSMSCAFGADRSKAKVKKNKTETESEKRKKTLTLTAAKTFIRSNIAKLLLAKEIRTQKSGKMGAALQRLLSGRNTLLH